MRRSRLEGAPCALMESADRAAWRWRETWEAAWPRRDLDAIAALYSPSCSYRALIFRHPDRGVDGVRRYLTEIFAVESDIVCRFGTPVVDRNRAAVEWWASWTEGGEPLTLAGATILRFDEAGLVDDHRDYWNETKGTVPPYDDWQL